MKWSILFCAWIPQLVFSLITTHHNPHEQRTCVFKSRRIPVNYSFMYEQYRGDAVHSCSQCTCVEQDHVSCVPCEDVEYPPPFLFPIEQYTTQESHVRTRNTEWGDDDLIVNDNTPCTIANCAQCRLFRGREVCDVCDISTDTFVLKNYPYKCFTQQQAELQCMFGVIFDDVDTERYARCVHCIPGNTNQEETRANDNGTCICNDGFVGDACQYVEHHDDVHEIVPSIACNMGYIKQDKCVCLPGYYGNDCSARISQQAIQEDTILDTKSSQLCKFGASLSGTRASLLGKQCECWEGYTGDSCEEPICMRGTYDRANGNSVESCTCDNDWYGKRCDRHCHSMCNYQGTVCHANGEIADTCSCFGGWTGPYCEQMKLEEQENTIPLDDSFAINIHRPEQTSQYDIIGEVVQCSQKIMADIQCIPFVMRVSLNEQNNTQHSISRRLSPHDVSQTIMMTFPINERNTEQYEMIWTDGSIHAFSHTVAIHLDEVATTTAMSPPLIRFRRRNAAIDMNDERIDSPTHDNTEENKEFFGIEPASATAFLVYGTIVSMIGLIGYIVFATKRSIRVSHTSQRDALMRRRIQRKRPFNITMNPITQPSSQMMNYYRNPIVHSPVQTSRYDSMLRNGTKHETTRNLTRIPEQSHVQ